MKCSDADPMKYEMGMGSREVHKCRTLSSLTHCSMNIKVDPFWAGFTRFDCLFNFCASLDYSFPSSE
jgi:hypothetical protein